MLAGKKWRRSISREVRGWNYTVGKVFFEDQAKERGRNCLLAFSSTFKVDF